MAVQVALKLTVSLILVELVPQHERAVFGAHVLLQEVDVLREFLHRLPDQASIVFARDLEEVVHCVISTGFFNNKGSSYT